MTITNKLQNYEARCIQEVVVEPISILKKKKNHACG